MRKKIFLQGAKKGFAVFFALAIVLMHVAPAFADTTAAPADTQAQVTVTSPTADAGAAPATVTTEQASAPDTSTNTANAPPADTATAPAVDVSTGSTGATTAPTAAASTLTPAVEQTPAPADATPVVTTETPVVATPTAAVGPVAHVYIERQPEGGGEVDNPLPVQPKIKVTDANDNRVPGATVTAVLMQGSGSLRNVTAVSDDNGDAVFQNLGYNTPNEEFMMRFDSGDAWSDKTPFLKPMFFGDPYTVTITTQPAAQAGNSVDFPLIIQPEVLVKDQFNNGIAGVEVTAVLVQGTGIITNNKALTDPHGVAHFHDLGYTKAHEHFTMKFSVRKSHDARVESCESDNIIPLEEGLTTRIKIVSSNDPVIAGQYQTFQTFGFDQFDNSTGEKTNQTLFGIEAPAAGIWHDNSYVSEFAGTWQVIATWHGLTDKKLLTVIPAPASALVVVARANNPVGVKTNVVINAVDAFGNVAVNTEGIVITLAGDNGARFGAMAMPLVHGTVATWVVNDIPGFVNIAASADALLPGAIKIAFIDGPLPPEPPIPGTGIAVADIVPIRTAALADGTFEHGWAWKFKLIAPLEENALSMKFSNWLGGTTPLPTAGNVRFFSPQAVDANTPATAIPVAVPGAFSPALRLAGDIDPATPLREFEVIVEVAVPQGTGPGLYFANYGIETLPGPVN